MQCWLYSIRGQIIMSHYFHIKKMPIIISIVLVKFLTVVRLIYKIPFQDAINTNTTHQSVRDACVTRDSLRKLQFSKLTPKNSLNLHTQSLGDQWLQFALASIFPLRWVVCCVFTDCGLYIINTDFEPKLLFSNIRPILFKFCDLQYIQYNMELRYILILAKTRKTTLES